MRAVKPSAPQTLPTPGDDPIGVLLTAVCAVHLRCW
jgi:hypothetical protein